MSKLWDELRSLPIDMFSLPNQLVENHLTLLSSVGDSEITVRCKTPAALPVFVELLSTLKTYKQEPRPDRPKDMVNVPYPKYSVKEAEGYLIVSRVKADSTPIPIIHSVVVNPVSVENHDVKHYINHDVTLMEAPSEEEVSKPGKSSKSPKSKVNRVS